MFLSLIHIPTRWKGRYFCSQFVAEVLHKCQAAKLKKSSTLYLPKDLNKLREATCLLMAGESEEAERIADGIMVLHMESRSMNYPALLNIYDATRPKCTLVLLERYMEEAESPDKVDWLTVSRIYLSNRMPEKAMQALQRCTDTSAAYHYRLAQANEMSGKYKEAVESYKIYIGQSGLIGDGIIDQDTRFVEERVRHTDIYEKVRMRNIILWLSIA